MKFLSAVALAVLVASPAFAANSRHHKVDWYNAQARALQTSSNVVVAHGDYIGQDPDLNVQLQLRRDADSTNF